VAMEQFQDLGPVATHHQPMAVPTAMDPQQKHQFAV